MRIQCPFCGERDSREFTYLSGGRGVRPQADARNAPTEFFRAVYLRENRCGAQVELWHHTSGCRSWLWVTRDTQTHEISLAEFAGSRQPDD
jgi:heterotetrameric sarcosine oxidase delta subunit